MTPEHKTALRAAWLDLCHAHEALAPHEPILAVALRSVTDLMLDKYPQLAWMLTRQAQASKEA